MTRLTPVFRMLGAIILGLGPAMVPPLLFDLSEGSPTTPFFVLAIFASVIAGGALLTISASPEPFAMTRKQAFLATGLSWFLAPAFGAIPFLGLGVGFVDAYFESVSGITTTGSTILTGLDAMPRGILLWRSLLQWMGGFGIVALSIVVLPFLRVGGMQLFHTESSDSSEKLFARALDLARWIAGIYFGLSALCAVVYALLGMDVFDAVNHAMTTVSTAGFSTHDASFGHFGSPALEWAGTFFMIAGGVTFVAYIRMFRGRRQPIWRDVQVRAYLGFLTVATVVMAIALARNTGTPIGDALRLAAFNVGSVVTTTGYASADYQLWGPFAIGGFFILLFVGGCSGSTTGGIKIYRFQIAAKLARAYLTKLVSPSQVTVTTYGSRRVDAEVEIAILTFLVAVLFTEAVLTVILCWMGLDFLTAASSAAQAISNVGPALGPITGPSGTFAPLPDGAKVVLTIAMVFGRLEFFTLLVMLTPAFWRD